MKKANFESFNSKKFDSNQMNLIVGGVEPTTYGKVYGTYGHGSSTARDSAQTTYNPQGYPPGTEGQDPV